jgi:electron transport complex protein RnfB
LLDWGLDVMDTHMMLQAAQAVAAIGLLGASLGVVLGVAARYLSAPVDARADAVAALLPGSNCAQCGFAGCKQAAAAMVEGRAAPSCCPPGGASTAQRVAELLGVRLVVDGSDAALPTVAWVDEARCIGCTRCIRKCGSDAIVGAIKQMHTVLPEACYACGLCEAECPTQAIVMKPVLPTLTTWHWPKPGAKPTAAAS